MREYTPTTEELRAGREAHRASGTPMSLAVWLAAHDAKVRADVVAEEPEWEYGRTPELGYAVTVLSNTPGNIEYQREHGYEIVRRRKAGPWVPVEN